MVFFTCNACGEALKKNQVEKHTYQCRRCESLSCADCGKDFWGNDYQQHIKCVSEAEKYGGKNFKPKANANKGEEKQNLWVQQVQNAVEKCNTNPRVKSILQLLIDYPNIPRKQAKFENFLLNSLRVNDSRLAQNVWNCISAELKKDENGDSAAKIYNDATELNEKTDSQEKSEDVMNGGDEQQDSVLNKRERKEERRKKTHKLEKKDAKIKKNNIENSETEATGSVENDNKCEKKSRKRKREENGEVENVTKKHSRNGDACAPEENEETVHETDEFPQEHRQHGTKFKWNSVMVSIITQAGGEMKLKKLQRKVLSQYLAQGGDPRDASENAAIAKFTKKLSKNSRLSVENNLVLLQP